VHRLIRVPTAIPLPELVNHVFYGITVTTPIDAWDYGQFGAGFVPPAPMIQSSARDAMEAIRILPALPAKSGIPSLHTSER
ncbi:uncharacterized protein CLUP02_12962, partial [Colletotrichum lupini]